MINTFYGLNSLNTGSGFLTALIIGILFGFALERAGFGSSRRLAGIFYFKDMAVLKVMFSAMITAIIGLTLFEGLGIIDPASQIYHLKTYYGTHIFAGLIFGVGFVTAGWCPGTSIVGAASGKIDAMVFLAGGVVGSILFNELFPVIKPLYKLGISHQNSFGISGVAFIYKSLGLPKVIFVLLFIILAVTSFWGAEYFEIRFGDSKNSGEFFKTEFLKVFSFVFVIFAIFVVFVSPDSKTGHVSVSDDKAYLKSIASGEDHIGPKNLAELMFIEDESTIVVDVRSAFQFKRFHLRGAINVELPDLPVFVRKQKHVKRIVLYSNGMTHPAQARDLLYKKGYRNVFILTDGLNGFINKILKPVSLRNEPMALEKARQINEWRSFFLKKSEIAGWVKEN